MSRLDRGRDQLDKALREMEARYGVDWVDDAPDMTVVGFFCNDWEETSRRNLWRDKATGEVRHWDPSAMGWPIRPDDTGTGDVVR